MESRILVVSLALESNMTYPAGAYEPVWSAEEWQSVVELQVLIFNVERKEFRASSMCVISVLLFFVSFFWKGRQPSSLVLASLVILHRLKTRLVQTTCLRVHLR